MCILNLKQMIIKLLKVGENCATEILVNISLNPP